MIPPEIAEIAQVMLDKAGIVDNDLAIETYNQWVQANASPAYAGNDSLQLMTFITRNIQRHLGQNLTQADEYP